MSKKRSNTTTHNNSHIKGIRHGKHKKFKTALAIICIFLTIIMICFFIYESGTPSFSVKDYPPSLVALAKTQPEAIPFVQGYPDRNVPENVDISVNLDDEYMPLFLQWDNRWGYTEYGDDFLAITGCGPTCLSMVYVYLTGDTSMHPGKMAQWAEQEGFYVPETGTSWDLMDLGAEILGLNVSTTSLGSSQIASALLNNEVIICSVGPGDFTTEGHFIVLAGIDENYKVIVRDPNSRKRSEKKWDLEKIIPQIKQFWIYS